MLLLVLAAVGIRPYLVRGRTDRTASRPTQTAKMLLRIIPSFALSFTFSVELERIQIMEDECKYSKHERYRIENQNELSKLLILF